MTTKRVTHEYELISDSFDEAIKEFSKCYATAESKGRFEYAVMSRETDYSRLSSDNIYTGRFEIKLKWSEPVK